MERQSKTLVKTVVLDCYANKYSRRALREIEGAYREMLVEMVEYAVKYRRPRRHYIKSSTRGSGRGIRGSLPG